MDLLNPNVPLELYDPSWKIYSRNPCMPPHYLADSAVVQNSMITEGCYVAGSVDFSILFSGVTVEEGAVVRDSILMPGTVVKSGAVIEYAIVAERVTVEADAHIGRRPEEISDKDSWGVAVVGEGLTIGAGSQVSPKAIVTQDLPAGAQA